MSEAKRCSDCGAEVSSKVELFSLARFKKIFCFKCQKKLPAAEPASETPVAKKEPVPEPEPVPEETIEESWLSDDQRRELKTIMGDPIKVGAFSGMIFNNIVQGAETTTAGEIHAAVKQALDIRIELKKAVGLWVEGK